MEANCKLVEANCKLAPMGLAAGNKSSGTDRDTPGEADCPWHTCIAHTQYHSGAGPHFHCIATHLSRLPHQPATRRQRPTRRLRAPLQAHRQPLLLPYRLQHFSLRCLLRSDWATCRLTVAQIACIPVLRQRTDRMACPVQASPQHSGHWEALRIPQVFPYKLLQKLNAAWLHLLTFWQLKKPDRHKYYGAI